MHRLMVSLMVLAVAAASVAHDRPAMAAEVGPNGAADGATARDDTRPVRLELALMPTLREQ